MTTAVASAPIATVRDVTHVFGQGATQHVALRDMSLTVRQGEFVCLAGASGCGKSTLLHLLAGLDQPTQGRVTAPFGEVAMMFQEAALFPWLSVVDNVAFPLKRAGRNAKEARDEAAHWLGLVGLGQAIHRQPHELSGGMKQRAALARCLAQKARLLLMDEPFSALDALMRERLHDELERLYLSHRFTVVFVTHDPREAVRLGDRVVMLTSNPGRILSEIPVDLPRPRRSDTPETALLAGRILEALNAARPADA